MAEMSQSQTCNFSPPSAFKLVASLERGFGSARRDWLESGAREVSMRHLKYFALLAVMMVMPLAYSQAQWRGGVGIGYGPGYVAGPPGVPYGYYDYYPHAG